MFDKIPNIPSVSSLQHEKQIKDSSKNDIFNIVLNKIVQKIIYTNRHTDQTYIIYEIPQILIGYPQYDMKSCILFVMERLASKNYFIEFVNPFYLYIDWGSQMNSNINNVSNKPKMLPKSILQKFPNTSKIEIIYEDQLKKKRRPKK